MSRDERLRLFLALRLGDDVLGAVEAWQRARLHGVRGVPREHLHVTLAFLGHRPAGELEGIVGALRDAAAAASRIRLAPLRYRETRSVGMLVLDDEAGRAPARSRPTCRSAWNSSAPIAGRAVRGCRTSRSLGFASGRGCGSSRRRWEHSFRPTRLLTCHGCGRAARSTKSSKRWH